MITIKNRQKKIKIDSQQIKSNVQKMLDVIGYSDFDIGIWLTTNKTIRSYNKRYRHKAKPTDILSFSYHQDLLPGQTITIRESEDQNLGDLIISLEYAKKDAEQKGVVFLDHITILLAHGIAHLLGYDHESEQEYKVMKKKEQQLLAALK